MKFKVAGIDSRSRRHIFSRFATDGLPESSCTQKTFDRAFKELSNGMSACRTRSNGSKLFKINEAVRMARRLWRAVDLWNVFDFYENGAETQPFRDLRPWIGSQCGGQHLEPVAALAFTSSPAGGTWSRDVPTANAVRRSATPLKIADISESHRGDFNTFNFFKNKLMFKKLKEQT